jgi:hypothetical protein
MDLKERPLGVPKDAVYFEVVTTGKIVSVAQLSDAYYFCRGARPFIRWGDGADLKPRTGLTDEQILRLAAVEIAHTRLPTFPGVPAKDIERAFKGAFLSRGGLDPVWWERFDAMVRDESRGSRWVKLQPDSKRSRPDGAIHFVVIQAARQDGFLGPNVRVRVVANGYLGRDFYLTASATPVVDVEP